MAQPKLIAMSALLTVLVWLFADQLLTESVTFQVVFEPVAAVGESYNVSTPAERPQHFQIALSGPQKAVAQIRETPPATVPLPVEPRTTGRVSIKIIDILQRNPAQFPGLTVESVTPEYLEVAVDREITVTLPVWVDPGVLDYDVDPSSEPDHVQVTISQRRFNDIPAEKRRLVVPAEDLLRNQPKGQLLSFPVPLEAKVDGVEVKDVTPARVDLRATVRELRVTGTIPAVPIRVAGSVDLWNEFRVDLGDRSTMLTQPVTVRGPAEIVARLTTGDIKVTGLIALSRDDTLEPERDRAKRPVFVGLPPGVELADPKAIEPVEFRLVRDEPATP